MPVLAERPKQVLTIISWIEQTFGKVPSGTEAIGTSHDVLFYGLVGTAAPPSKVFGLAVIAGVSRGSPPTKLRKRTM